jgi:hypothetical protein
MCRKMSRKLPEEVEEGGCADEGHDRGWFGCREMGLNETSDEEDLLHAMNLSSAQLSSAQRVASAGAGADSGSHDVFLHGTIGARGTT